MIAFQETYVSQFSTRQLFELVADIEKYPEFLPWCSAARIINREGNRLIAELVIHFAPFYQSYTSKVTLCPPKDDQDNCEIKVELVEGPFDLLNNNWQFKRNGSETDVTFTIEFQFSSKVMQRLIGAVFEKALKKMVRAFKARAEQVYGQA